MSVSVPVSPLNAPQQDGDALAALHVLAVAVLVIALAGDDEQSGQVLGTFAVAAHPEQVGQHARRADEPGAAGQLHRRYGQRLGLDARRRPHPDVLGRNAVQLVGGVARRQHITQAADHGRVAAALGDREQPHPDAGRRQHARVMVGGRRGELRQLLADPLPRRGLDAIGQFAALGGRQCRADDGLAAHRRLDQQRRQPRQQMRAFPVEPAPVERRGVQQRLLPQQPLGQLRQEPLQPRAFQDARAQGVDHRDRAAALHLDQADHTQPRVRPQVQRVDVLGVDPAQHHVDPLEGAQRPHPQPAVADHQVGTLHQREAQHRRQVGLVERGLGVDARAEHHHHRVLGRFRGGVDQRQPQRLGERRRRPRPDPLVDVGDGVGDHPAVGQRVAGSRRSLRPVGVDQEAAVGRPAHITAVHEQLMATGILDAAGRPDVAGMAEQQLGRQDPAGDRPARPVQVGQDGVEQPGALHHTGFQRLPVRRRQQQRDAVQMPGARHRDALSVGDGLAAQVESRVAALLPFGMVDLDVGDAVVVDQSAHDGAQPLQSGAAAFADEIAEFLPGRPDGAGGVDELVVPGAPERSRGSRPGAAAAQVEQRVLRPCRAVAGEQTVGIMGGLQVRTGSRQRQRHHLLTDDSCKPIAPARPCRVGDPISSAARYAPGAGRGSPARRHRWTGGPVFPGCRPRRRFPG